MVVRVCPPSMSRDARGAAPCRQYPQVVIVPPLLGLHAAEEGAAGLVLLNLPAAGVFAREGAEAFASHARPTFFSSARMLSMTPRAG